MIKLKRAYEAASEDDGLRILVERLWPRGVSKKEAKIDLWLKDVAPGTDLRKWYGHDPARWAEFCRRYRAELKGRGDLLARKRGTGDLYLLEATQTGFRAPRLLGDGLHGYDLVG